MDIRSNDLPSLAQMQAMAERSLARLPARFREHLTDIVLRVTDFATPEQLEAVDIDNRWNLSGLYEGRPLPDKSVWDHSDMPPAITLFRNPLLREWQETGVDLESLIHHVVVHEAGHHFGFSDEDMHQLEDEAD
ncbi:metallopeptidase family protein [Altererythrobacter sp. SALINAS58]|uniref:metallopeptidase family protein n=1 Tax=Alteripontixanthobacter muriae TaxID=2705546 RepID=UPI0015766121|nr:metallopeptidase family protein [Alteripontixanthobacter muriae]NTZ42074.1 metallopeptidase family protein [Alteripontixanthobacter muriae]